MGINCPSSCSQCDGDFSSVCISCKDTSNYLYILKFKIIINIIPIFNFTLMEIVFQLAHQVHMELQILVETEYAKVVIQIVKLVMEMEIPDV